MIKWILFGFLALFLAVIQQSPIYTMFASKLMRSSTLLPIRSATGKHMSRASLFTASIGSSFCPKRRSDVNIKSDDTGEDAFFVNLKEKVAWIGVLDGVGGWADMGVNPAEFSHGLSRHLENESKAATHASPKDLLQKGYDALLADKSVEMGSSTAVVASVDLESALLKVANLGDSGYFICSGQKLLYASKPQTYYFNAPYQLSKMPSYMRGKGSLENKPADAESTNHVLKTNEFAVFATDGFFDNIFTKDAITMINTIVQSKKNWDKQDLVNEIAKKLTEEAKIAGRSTTRNGPFAYEAAQHGIRGFHGGKEDDIVVVVLTLSESLQISSKL